MIITWFCLICLSLHIPNSRTAGPVTRFYEVPGGKIKVQCSFPSSGEWKIFCWENCEEKNILIETRKTSDRNGRYRIETSGRVLYVSISALTQSDSGWYRCNLKGRDPYRDFNLTVTDAVRLTTTKTTTKTTTTSTTRSFSSSASSFTSSGSSAPTKRSALGDGNKSSPDVLLIVGLALVFIIIFIILTVALLVFCRNRSQRHAKDPAVKTKKTAVETTRVYEEVRGDEMKSVPVEICTVYSYASYSKPAAADGVYSLVTAALPLDKAEDDLTGPTYAQVNFPYRRSDKPSDDAVHSVRRVAVGSHVGEESLYSNTA
ncbi:CMRF35-like molecule 3 isoform X2 [Gambusia affinis]|uniref:CMRF35-like molecule 3 isoform X2 n=1 Tax=Gambusia affinis TaxID=33528 RepID=UPI001CDD4176|nr:CMRF35-like molecule 3 isoform X2 [Gambusia affinis]